MELKTGIEHENFDRYFIQRAKLMSESEKVKIPKTFLDRLFTRRGNVSTRRITFFQKIYILLKAFGTNTYILIRDPEGSTPEEFMKLLKDAKSKKFDDIAISERMIASGVFVLSSAEMIDTIANLNYKNVSPAYNYILRLKNAGKKNFYKYKKEANFVSEMLVQYESTKAHIAKLKNLHHAEWYTLIWLYNGKEKIGSETYLNIFKGAFMAKQRTFNTAYNKLIDKGLIERVGRNKTAKYRITPLGIDMVNDLLSNYIIP